jgi:hypothetical protein
VVISPGLISAFLLESWQFYRIVSHAHPEWMATSYAAERMVRIEVDCGPCQQRIGAPGPVKCMRGVSVEMVLSAARELLADGRSLAGFLRSNTKTGTTSGVAPASSR